MNKISKEIVDKRITLLTKDYLNRIKCGTLTFIVQDNEIIQLNIKEVFRITSQKI